MGDTTSALSGHDEEQLHHGGSRVAPSRRLLRRPTLAETNGSRVTAQPRGFRSR
jgi:hypothetical protein